MPRTIQLQRLKFAVMTRLSTELVDSFANEPQVLAETLGDNIVFSVRFMIFGAEHESLTVDWPATWWDHLRYSKFPAWINKRWPPRMIVRKMVARALYPMLPDKLMHADRINVLSLE